MIELLWPKTYATVVMALSTPGEPESWIYVKTDDGQYRHIPTRWGCGGRGKRLVIGARIKIYQRDRVNHVNFRMVGR
jgi:hypothetical protein